MMIPDHPRPPRLHLLPLTSPHVLLPGARVSLPLSNEVAEPLIRLLTDSDDQHLIVAGVPLVANESDENAEQKWNSWGCAARVVRIVRPPALQTSQAYLVSLQGLHRIRLQLPSSPSLAVTPPLSVIPVVYPPSIPPPSGKSIETFKSAALRLTNTFGNSQRDRTPKIIKFDSWSRLRDLVQSVSSHDDEARARAPWVSDLIVAVISVDYQDKLDYLATPNPDDRLCKAAELFDKKVSVAQVRNQVAQDVQETVSNQQKEIILRQSMMSIQRELARLRSGGGQGRSDPLGRPPGPLSELDDDEETSELADIKKKIEAMGDGSDEKKVAVREFKRLKKIPPSSAENSIIRNYLDWLTALPWASSTTPAHTAGEENGVMDRSFLVRARKQLDDDHFGMEPVKRRLIEYLAVMRLKDMAASREAAALAAETTMAPTGDLPKLHSGPAKRVMNKGPILLLVGPPGVGKTSIAASLARALNRPFHRISLGGVRDEAEIRGHRRTYVASSPGNIIQALRKVGRLDPVMLLDEIDKVGHSNHQGDPSAALLEVLDPEQNHSFVDHYINTPVDLSQVTFIATANSLDTISAPLLDRCEVIRLEGYTFDEKARIARRWLIPKQVAANGFGMTTNTSGRSSAHPVVDESKFSVTDEALIHLVSHYTREAGVRSLERAIGALVRAKAVQWSELSEDMEHLPKDAQKKGSYDPVIKKADLEAILGPERFDPEERDQVSKRGVVFGMVVMGEGEGGILPVETIALPGTGQLRLTGSLGDVIRESADIALSWVKAHAYALGVTPSPSVDALKHPDPIDIHLHLPSGAQKKDGPSAGIAMVCAFVSLLSGAVVPTHIAMTGEITLRGNVTPVGGVKEKVLGAHRAGIRKVILPWRNRRDLETPGANEGGDGRQDGPGGLPREVREGMELVYVSTIVEALNAAFEGVVGWSLKEGSGGGRGGRGFPVESRL